MQHNLDTLIQLIAKLPGLGPRSARRVALQLLKQKEQVMLPLSQALEQVAHAIKPCEICGNMDTMSPCGICVDPRRDSKQLCIVEDVADLWAFERSYIHSGKYHVLGGVLSAMNGVGPEDLFITSLPKRIQDEGVEEIILALNATMDGQTTAHYLVDVLQPLGVTITQLAHGIPVGGELDYLDEGTLSMALKSRKAAG